MITFYSDIKKHSSLRSSAERFQIITAYPWNNFQPALPVSAIHHVYRQTPLSSYRFFFKETSLHLFVLSLWRLIKDVQVVIVFFEDTQQRKTAHHLAATFSLSLVVCVLISCWSCDAQQCTMICNQKYSYDRRATIQLHQKGEGFCRNTPVHTLLPRYFILLGN